MKNPLTSIKEPMERASLASGIALGIALIALVVAFRAMAKTGGKSDGS